MYKSYKDNSVLQFIKSFLHRLKRMIYLIIIASMLGFSNAFYDESKMINNIKFGYEEEQIIDDKEPKDWKRPITSATRKSGSSGFRCASFRSGSFSAWQEITRSPHLRVASYVVGHIKHTFSETFFFRLTSQRYLFVASFVRASYLQQLAVIWQVCDSN